MKGLVIGYEGCEENLYHEVKELIGIEGNVQPSVVGFDCNEEDLAKLAYFGQGFSYVLNYIGNIQIKTFEDIEQISKFDFSFLKDKTFKVNCVRVGEHDFSSMDIASKAGELLMNSGGKVDLRTPEIVVLIYIFKEVAYIGIDIAGIDLSKRDYNVYVNKRAVRGPVAYNMLRFAGYTGKEVLIDPFCISGNIAIEAAYIKSKIPINFYRKDKLAISKTVDLSKFDNKEISSGDGSIYAIDPEMSSIKAAKQNAKIGGVDKFIEYSRNDPEWLDVKFKEEEVDLIVSIQPPATKHLRKKVLKWYEELFHHSEFILKKGGRLLLMDNKDIRDVNTSLRLTKEIEFNKFGQIIRLLLYERA